MAEPRPIDLTLVEDEQDSGHDPGSAPGGPPRRQHGDLVLAPVSPEPSVRRSWPRRPPPGAMWLGVLSFGVILVLVLLVSLQGSPVAAPPPVVVVSTPYWNVAHAGTAVLGQRQDVSEVSPSIYAIDAAGDITDQYAPGAAAATQASLAQLRKAGLKLVPTVANVVNGGFTYQPLAGILHDPARAAHNIAAILALVQRQNYAGIDIDYENLHSGDRQAFTDFITQLADTLHAHGKTLSVTLFAKASDAGYDQRNVAQDYAAIGKVADEVRLMGYDYHWAISAPGPIAPVNWIQDVLRYAVGQIAPSKIILGIPMYGYDWVDGHGTPVAWLQAFRLANQYHAQIQFDAASQTPWFSYTDAKGQYHVVWFENAASATAKLDVARNEAIGGVYLWLYGYEDTNVWSALHQSFPISKPASATTGGGTP
ncbi:MAG TPA: glycosyl hydrolase family 18 protein [Pseudonocardiaceae bacterium]|jgi:spore germination protein YaaH|nr:glycosyl hydrolase family 18 protein [Pseudonocardiaceae bacterium]